jgi:rubrerythrin
MKQSTLKTLTNSIKCLIVFENKTASLYTDLAEKTQDLPMVKSLLLQVSLDSQKHATVLKGIVQSVPKTSWNPNELPKAFANAWRSIDAFQIELADVEKIADEDLTNLPEQLSELEGTMSKAYDLIVQYENLKIISTELTKIYNATFESLKLIFIEIIHDEEHHKKILATIAELLDQEEEKIEAAPMVRFQNPDAWSRPAQ